jgi:hypothetical protein
MREFLVALAIMAAPFTVRGQEALPPKVLKKVKAATVFVRVQIGRSVAGGSGFVIRTNKNVAYIATNEHVINPKPAAVAKPAPPNSKGKAPVALPVPPAKITVVFQSGTEDERAFPARVVFVDKGLDLAILQVAGLKNPPEMLKFEGLERPTETTPIFLFGFPFGEGISREKGYPAVTVGKGSVTALRLFQKKELLTVQIECEIHPGNSGGPVVDVKGNLVGMAKAKLRNTRFGVALAAEQLAKVVNGKRVSLNPFSVTREANKADIKIHFALFNPFKRLKSVTFHYLPTESLGGKPVPAGRRLSEFPKGNKLPLKLSDFQAEGTLSLRVSGEAVKHLTWQLVLAYEKDPAIVTTPFTLQVNLRPTEEFKPLTDTELDEALKELGSATKEAPLRAAKRLALARPDPARRADVVDSLKLLLTHKDALTRAAGVRAFGSWGGKDSIPFVVKSLKDDTSMVRRAAMEVLGKSRDEQGAEAVARLLRSESDRFDAGNALRGMGAIAEKSVRKYLKDDNRRVKVEACGILKAIGTRESLSSLTSVAERDSDIVVARAALEAVKAIKARP